jgi:hypothetical protein
MKTCEKLRNLKDKCSDKLAYIAYNLLQIS